MTPPPLHVMWQTAAGDLLHGFDNANQKWVDQELTLGLAFPDAMADAQTVLLRSSASFLQSAEVLINVRIYLCGDPDTVQALNAQWPASGGGLDISFDNGVTWLRFLAAGEGLAGAGDESDSSTWIPLPGSAISSVAVNGQIGPNDVASVLLRLQVPPGERAFGVYRMQLGVDFDVL